MGCRRRRVGLQSRPATPLEGLSSSPESPGEGAEEGGAPSLPPPPRRTRSSGLGVEKSLDDLASKRPVRKPAEFRFLNESSGRMKRPEGTTALGDEFQAEVPTLSESAPGLEADREEVCWLPAPEQGWSADLDRFVEMARVCRSVLADQALKHLFDRQYDLERALRDFEALPLPQFIWKPGETSVLVKKLAQGRKVQHIQKHVSLSLRWRSVFSLRKSLATSTPDPGWWRSATSCCTDSAWASRAGSART